MSTEKSLRKLPNCFIGKESADEKIDRYKANKYPGQCESSAKAKQGDTLSVWYDKEHIEDLLNEIEDNNGNGIRISFGMYEEDHKYYPSQTCLVFSVTRLNEENFKTEDILIENEPRYPERVQLTAQSKIKEDFNLGSLCPPRCNPTGIGG